MASKVQYEQKLTHIITLLFFFFVLFSSQISIASQKELNLPPKIVPLDIESPLDTVDIMRAGQLGGSLFPVDFNISLRKLKTDDGLKRKTNVSFANAVNHWNDHDYQEAIELFKQHISEYPNSLWKPEALLHMGCDARYNGKYTQAEALYNEVLEMTEGNTSLGGQMMTNKARLRLGVLRTLQNNDEQAKEYFSLIKKESPDWRQRTYASGWLLRLNRNTISGNKKLNCGLQALELVLDKELTASTNNGVDQPSNKGYSISDIIEIASHYRLSLAAYKIDDENTKNLPCPTILFIPAKSSNDIGHYWVLTKISDSAVTLIDPQSGRTFQQSFDELKQEWGGVALLGVQGKKLGEEVALNDLEDFYGGCCGVPRLEEGPGRNNRNPAVEFGKSPGREGQGFCPQGSPVWEINPVTMNFYMADIPMWYKSPIGPGVSITVSYNSQSAFSYNEPFGNKWQFNYGTTLVEDTGGNVSIFMPDGRRDVYTPNGDGTYDAPYQVNSVLTKLANNSFTLRFLSDLVFTYQIPSGTSSQQPFLTQITDAEGLSLSFQYNQQVQLETITDATGKVFALVYNDDGLAESVSDPFGRSAVFEYDENRNMISITDMGGYQTRFTYTEDVYLETLENNSGTWAFYFEPADGIYNSLNKYPAPGDPMWEDYRITVTDPLGNKEEYYFDGYYKDSYYTSKNEYVDYTDSTHNSYYLSDRIKYDFTSTDSGQRGEVSRITYPNSEYKNFSYTNSGDISVKSDSLSSITASYNIYGLPTEIENGSLTETVVYKANNVDVQSITNEIGTLQFEHDNKHRLTARTDYYGNRESYTYNEYGQILFVLSPLGVQKLFEYNSQHRLQTVQVDGNIVAEYTYDAKERVQSVKDNTDMTISLVHDDLNRVTEVLYPNGQTEEYVYSSCCPRRLVQYVDMQDGIWNYEYDAIGRKIKETDPGKRAVHFEYDANSNLTAFKNQQGKTTKYEYDTADRLLKREYPTGETEIFSYNNSGLVEYYYPSGNSAYIRYDYNNLKQLSSIYYLGSPVSLNTTSYNYDDAGRLSSVTGNHGTTAYNYASDKYGVTVDGPWENDSLTYELDAHFRLKNIQVENGLTRQYAYDAFDRLTRLSFGSQETRFSYDGVNTLQSSITRANGSATAYQYDSMNRITEVLNKTSSGDVLSQYNYAYNKKGLISSITTTDEASQYLTENQLNKFRLNSSNQITSINDDTYYAYDAAGNLTHGYTPENEPFVAEYDILNLLRRITVSGNDGNSYRTEYTYDHNHSVIKEQLYINDELSNEKRFVLSSPFMPLQERSSENEVLKEYLWGNQNQGGVGDLISLAANGSYYEYLYDGRFNVTGLINSSQSLASRYFYSTYGELLHSDESGVQQPFKLTTKYYNGITGLVNYGYRFYSPKMRTWMHRDPIREAGGYNFYFYASNDPINFIDPNGLSPVKTVGWVIKLSKKGYKLIKKVSGEEALKAVKKGENIIANSHAEARKLARKASEKKKPIRDPAHKPGEGQMPHYHPNPRSGGHIFYSIAPLLTFSHHTGGAWWGEALDFVNPLSLGQDLIEIKECLNDPL